MIIKKLKDKLLEKRYRVISVYFEKFKREQKARPLPLEMAVTE